MILSVSKIEISFLAVYGQIPTKPTTCTETPLWTRALLLLASSLRDDLNFPLVRHLPQLFKETFHVRTSASA